MVDATTIEIIVVILVFFAVGFIMLLRAKSMKKLNLLCDFRNSTSPPGTFFAQFNKKEKIIRIYGSRFSLFSIKPDRPYFDPNAFMKKDKSIDVYQGITGKDDDDNLYPRGITVTSSASAKWTANTLSNGVIEKLAKLGIHIDNDSLKALSGKIPTKNKGDKPTLEDVFAYVFDAKWIMDLLGVIDIQDANVVMQHQKMQIADLHTGTNEFKTKHYSWATKNGPLILTAVMFVIVAIGAVILWNGATQDAQLLQSQATSSSNVASLLSQYLHHTSGTVPLPNTTTTIAPGSGNFSIS